MNVIRHVLTILPLGLAIFLSGCTDSAVISPSPSVQPSQSPVAESENEDIEIIEGNLDLENKTYTIQYQEELENGDGETTSFTGTFIYELILLKQPLNDSGYYIDAIDIQDISSSPDDYLMKVDEVYSQIEYEKNHQILKFLLKFEIVPSDDSSVSDDKEYFREFYVVIDLLELVKNQ